MSDVYVVLLQKSRFSGPLYLGKHELLVEAVSDAQRFKRLNTARTHLRLAQVRMHGGFAHACVMRLAQAKVWEQVNG